MHRLYFIRPSQLKLLKAPLNIILYAIYTCGPTVQFLILTADMTAPITI